MRPDADPRGCALSPVVVGIACALGAGMWLFSFKLLAMACRVVAGAGQ
ncbi:hypothetical protein [Sphingobium sp. KCTC 72723]|nr:hypothetical protein [Sphingobium sp. KCTC 72723]